jgi:hypothetical protein
VRHYAFGVSEEGSDAKEYLIMLRTYLEPPNVLLRKGSEKKVGP